MLWSSLAGIWIVTAFVAFAEGQALPSPPTEWMSLRTADNELTARRTAPVVYRSLEALTAALEHRLPERSRAIRVVRTSPPQTIDYTICVTSEGTLVLGEQTFALDQGTRRDALVTHGLSRAYPPLEHVGSWIWLVTLPLSREVTAMLVIRATSPGWPVRSVTIDVSQEQNQ